MQCTGWAVGDDCGFGSDAGRRSNGFWRVIEGGVRGEASGELDWKRRGENRMGGNAIWAGGGEEGAIFDRSSAGLAFMLQSKK